MQARCSFLLQNNNTSFKWSSFFEAQRVEAFSISLAVSNQVAEALACVINFAANMGQLKHIPIQRSHLLSIPLGRKGNEMCLLCSAEARGQSRRRKKSEFLAGKKTFLKRKLWEKLTPRTLPVLFSKSVFLSRLWMRHAPGLQRFAKAFPFIGPAVNAFAALHTSLLWTRCMSSAWKGRWEWKSFIIKECCDE